MSSIQAIETTYNGYRFRSRLEARWAVFFDALGIQWKYEREGYALDPVTFDGVDSFVQEHSCHVPAHVDLTPAERREFLKRLRLIGENIAKTSAETIRYLPDFWLPGFAMWAEVKGDLVLESLDKMIRLCNQSQSGLIILQEPGVNMSILLSNDERHSNRIGDMKTASFRRCPICRNWALRNECKLGDGKECDSCRQCPTVYYYCIHCALEGKVNLRVKKIMEWVPLPPHDEVSRAIAAAHSARFEHGETPRVPRGRPRN